MEDIASSIPALLTSALVIWVVIWLFILLPARMARERKRSATIWVLISFVGSPALAILLLIALGDANTRQL